MEKLLNLPLYDSNTIKFTDNRNLIIYCFVSSTNHINYRYIIMLNQNFFYKYYLNKN